MNRRFFSQFASASLLGLSTVAMGQQPGKVWRVGFLAGGPRPPDGAPPEPLRKALQALGYIEGKDVVYESRWGEVRNERLPALAAELVALKVDLIITFGAPSAIAAKAATSTIPIVVIFAGDTVESGLVASLARPGGNVTGINDPAATLSAKRLELIKELVPTAQRVAVLWNMSDNAMTLRYREIEKAAHLLRVTIEPLGVREPDDFDAALAAMNRSRPDALMMISDALTSLNRKRVIDYAAQNRVPAIYELPNAVHSGGLMSYGSDPGENLKLAAAYVARIFKGAKPVDLPVEQPNRYYLIVNQATVNALGIKMPQTLMLRADEIIQ